MSHHQILPPLPTVENTMDDVAVTCYNHPGSAFTEEGWQEELQHELQQLLSHSLPTATDASSTDSSPEAVIHKVLLQFR